MIGRSLVEGCSGKVTLEMFNPSEEAIVLHKNTHTALVHPLETIRAGEELCEESHKERTPPRGAPRVLLWWHN